MISMGTVWDRATEFLSDNIGALLPLALLAIFLPVAISQSLEPLTKTPGAGAMTIQLLSIVLSIISLWGQLAITALALDPIAGRPAATAIASKRLVPVILVSLAILLGLIVLMLPMMIVLGVSGFDFEAAANGGSPSIPPGIGGFLAVYLLVFVGVVLWLGARLALISPVILKEHRWFGALGRSYKLTRPITLKIIGVLILYAIVWGVAFLAAKTVFGFVFGLIAGGEGPVTLGSVLTALCVSVVLTMFSVLASAFVGKLYLAVRDAREAIVESL
jgi:hypothetical protein